METYIAYSFWVGILSMAMRGFFLISEHPRTQRPVNIGTDAFCFILSIALFGWVAYLKYSI